MNHGEVRFSRFVAAEVLLRVNGEWSVRAAVVVACSTVVSLGEDAGWLVDYEEGVVFVHDVLRDVEGERLRRRTEGYDAGVGGEAAAEEMRMDHQHDARRWFNWPDLFL
jgi:hypothetical protein